MEMHFKKYLTRPDFLCWMMIPLVAILGFVAGNKYLDIQYQIYDTYYVIAYMKIAKVFIILLAITGGAYHIVKRLGIKLNKRLIIWHLILSLSGFLLVMGITVITGNLSNSNHLDMDLHQSYLLILMILAGLISISISVSLLIVNVIFGLVKK